MRDLACNGLGSGCGAEAVQRTQPDGISEHEQGSMSVAKRSTVMADVNRKLVDARRLGSKSVTEPKRRRPRCRIVIRAAVVMAVVMNLLMAVSPWLIGPWALRCDQSPPLYPANSQERL